MPISYRPAPVLAARGVLGVAATVLAASALSAAITNANPGDASGRDPRDHRPLTSWVDPFIGTGGHGHTFPGATRPFGMVQLSPDTGTSGWDRCSGYHASDSTLLGFSHTHLSGTGIADYGDILLLPFTGEIAWEPGAPEDPDGGYRTRFRHETERAAPGYYRVHLDDDAIDVELTATPRVGAHRYHAAATESLRVLVDLIHGLGPDRVVESWLRVASATSWAAHRRSAGWAADQRVFAVAEFSRPVVSVRIRVGDEEVLAAPAALLGRVRHGDAVRAVFTFAPSAEPLVVEVALSPVGAEGARANLDAEGSGFDFDRVRREADAAWERALGRIRVSGGSDRDRRVFHTALYHTMIAPNLYSDVDGRTRTMDGRVTSFDRPHYTVFSLWDTFRALHPLHALLDPERAADFVRALLAGDAATGRLPIWSLAANETGTMIGDHAVSVIADAMAKGIPIEDPAAALDACVRACDARDRGRDLLDALGYIPCDREPESVSKLLEYAYDDWCVSAMARRVADAGSPSDRARRIRVADAFAARASAPWTSFDPESRFMRPRTLAGRWLEPFDPRFDLTRRRHYTEANAWQYTWFVPHDVAGLIDRMGGDAAFVARLDSLFAAPPVTGEHTAPDVTGLIGQYAHGNEPSHHVAFLYAYAGAPHRTEAIVGEILDTLHDDTRAGLPGNEDCGQMSAWIVFAMLGLYPVCPGQPTYVTCTPRFDRAEIRFGPGGTGEGSDTRRPFVIEAGGDGAYVRDASLGGRPFRRTVLTHAEITGGGTLRVTRGREPDLSRGREPDDRPPSPAPADVTMPPVIVAEAESFVDSLRVTLDTPPGTDAFVTLDGTAPGPPATRHTGPLALVEDTLVRARAVEPGARPSRTVWRRFVRVPGRQIVEITHPYSELYTAGGDRGLVDGLSGSTDYADGRWQGYEHHDLDVLVDLEAPTPIHSITLGCLQDVGVWIFLPEFVDVALSQDGAIFTDVAHVTHTEPQDRRDVFTHEFRADFDGREARYVRVRARNVGTCPAWHRGAGRPCWVFADEVGIR